MKTETLPYQRNGVRYAFIDGRQQCIGAALGRRDHIGNPDQVRTLRLRRVPMIDHGCYDPGGALVRAPTKKRRSGETGAAL